MRDCFDFSEYSRLIKTNSSPVICKIDEHTAKTYGELRAKLFEAYAPRPKKTNKLRLEELKCPASSNELQIQENDLWLVAQAIVYNYTFVTRDKMNAIKMPKLIKFALRFIVFVVAIWLLFYFTIFLFFIAIILVWVYYLFKFLNLFWWRFENFFKKYDFNFNKRSKNNSEKNSHIKEKFFLDVDKEFDQNISDAEIKKK